MKIEEYNLKARYFPAFIVLFPFSIMIYQLISPEYFSLLKDNLFIHVSSQLSTNICLIFLLSHIIRYFGKNLFEANIYDNELDFPTTKYLLISDSYFTEDYKNSIKKKAENDFNIKFPSFNLEKENLKIAKKEISEIVGLIRAKVGKGKLLLQHNIEYGFTRNLIGGSILVTPICIVNFFVLNSLTLITINSVVLIFFSMLLIFSSRILNKFAELYAKRLFIEYLSL